ncbi:MAG: Holliday junction branch migration protein RuvA [Cytophagales bacterium]|nr:Holliday junction branch migration protein RuvA [Cytophagales bacterium]
MITYLRGKLVDKDPTYVVIDIQGVGYYMKISLNTFSAIKEMNEALIHAHLHIREDAHTLYGFSEVAEKKRFLDLISISGVGANTAMMVLSSLSPSELQQAIVNEQINVIKGVKGIGQKTAQRIVLELKDKMIKEGWEEKSLESPKISNTLQNEALSALITLGIPRVAAQKTIDAILKEFGQEIKLEELIKQALRRA